MKKKIVSMGTAQHPVPKELTEKNKNKFYNNFKKRSLNKSNHAYFDNDEKPVLLRLYFIGTIFDSTQEVLVVHKTFHLLLNDKEKEIGFCITIRTFDDSFYRLTVYKKRFKANMVKIK